MKKKIIWMSVVTFLLISIILTVVFVVPFWKLTSHQSDLNKLITSAVQENNYTYCEDVVGGYDGSPNEYQCVQKVALYNQNVGACMWTIKRKVTGSSLYNNYEEWAENRAPGANCLFQIATQEDNLEDAKEFCNHPDVIDPVLSNKCVEQVSAFY